MPNLIPAFSTVRTYNDFLDAYNANPCERGNITRNDLVRAWNIVSSLRGTPSAEITLTYATLNISQSSVRTIVSKLNTLFRHIGMLTPSQGISISYSGFYHSTVTVSALDVSGVSWDSTPAVTRGRRQDRVETRHENGHRARRGARNAPLDQAMATLPTANVPSLLNVASLDSSHVANLSAMFDGFDAFAGIDPSIFVTLQAEAE